MTATTAENLVERFDAGEDVLDYFDESAAVIEEPDPYGAHPLNIVPPHWLVDYYDAEAKRRGVSRRAVINTALVEWADERRERDARMREAV